VFGQNDACFVRGSGSRQPECRDLLAAEERGDPADPRDSCLLRARSTENVARIWAARAAAMITVCGSEAASLRFWNRTR
jgi:hypothetical protein